MKAIETAYITYKPENNNKLGRDIITLGDLKIIFFAFKKELVKSYALIKKLQKRKDYEIIPLN